MLLLLLLREMFLQRALQVVHRGGLAETSYVLIIGNFVHAGVNRFAPLN